MSSIIGIVLFSVTAINRLPAGLESSMDSSSDEADSGNNAHTSETLVKPSACRKYADVYTEPGIFDRLGQGAFGAVYKAYKRGQKKKDKKRAVAVKRVLRGDPHVNHMVTEAAILERLKGVPNTVAYKDYFPINTCKGNEKESLVTEFIGGQPLHKAVKTLDKVKNKKEIIGLVHQLFTGIDGIHKRGFKHGDLKSDNILVKCQDKDGGDNGNRVKKCDLKIIDFGLAKPVSEEYWLDGSPSYMAPETALHLDGPKDGKEDVWSACATIASMFNENGWPRLSENSERTLINLLNIWNS